MRRPGLHLAVLLVTMACVLGARAAPAAAFNPLGAVCDAATFASGVLGKACDVVQKGGRILTAAKKLLGGHVGGAIKAVLGAGKAVASRATAAVGLAAIGVWVLGGAKFALRATAKVISETTTPQLQSSWFSATYWRVAGIAALLTLPFLFAAVTQALLRSDATLLLRTVFGYLPLALLMVSIAAPLTTMLLSGSDELSALVASAAGQPGAAALGLGGTLAGISALAGSPFLLFFLGLLTVAGTLTLWLELLIREAAVYVVVLMLPLAFAALVWPARRAWAVRAVELLVALILSKFAIVAVLSLGGAAMDQAFGHGLTAPLVGLVLVMMGAFAPWILLRLVPLAEIASAAVGSLRGEARLLARAEIPFAAGVGAEMWAARATADMRRVADEADPVTPPRPAGELPRSVSAHDGGGPPGGSAGEEPEAPHGSSPEPPPHPSDPGPPGGAVGEGDDELTAAGGPSSAEAGRGPAPGSEGSPRPERAPGLPAMWQAEDLTWQPLILGTEGGWPPRIRLSPGDEGPSAPLEPPSEDLVDESNLLPPGQPPDPEDPVLSAPDAHIPEPEAESHPDDASAEDPADG